MRFPFPLFIPLVVGALAGLLGAWILPLLFPPTHDELIRNFYRTENAVHVSPHSVRKNITEGKEDFLLVDLRSQEEYEKEHIVGAVNIPAYRDPDRSAYDEVDRIVEAFRGLPINRNIVVYCYSMPCMTGRKVGQMLADRGIYVQHLGIGWNEWRHFWQLWNHEHEWGKTNVEDYVASGSAPGSFSGPVQISPCAEGQFGC